MHSYVIYGHADDGAGADIHIPRAQCYAATMEDAIREFCQFVRIREPDLKGVAFCMQQVQRTGANQSFRAVHGIAAVTITDVWAARFSVDWHVEHD